MYKKIEKSSKICLCMIKKTSCPYTQKSIPPKNKNRPLNIKFKKKRKRMKKIRKNQRKILKLSLFLTSRMVKLRKEKNQNKNKITGL